MTYLWESAKVSYKRVFALFRREQPQLDMAKVQQKLGKSVVSIKLLPVILGPEMAATILWAPGIFGLFLLKNPHAHKIPLFRGGFWVFFRKGGVEVPILFLWAWGFFFRKNGYECSCPWAVNNVNTVLCDTLGLAEPWEGEKHVGGASREFQERCLGQTHCEAPAWLTEREGVPKMGKAFKRLSGVFGPSSRSPQNKLRRHWRRSSSTPRAL